ncbi:MAG: glycosyltransferase family 39 protein [Betaproteobacteria bacterium]|nr:MAG: glycosyltransferase family 39 protein [Betaproteobacteria bacterium]
MHATALRPYFGIREPTPPLRWIASACLVCALLWFAGLEYRGLFMPDEGRYADIAREMLDSNDWVTPRHNGIKYLEKPPLQYWATAGAFAVFGADEWTARLWPALTSFLGILLAAFAGSRLAPGSPWIVTALTVAGCWGYFLGGQFLTLDMGLTFFLTAALLGFLLSRRADLPPRVERGWMILAWAAIACAVLSKGLIGIVLPGVALLVYVVIERDRALLRRLHWAPGLWVFGAIVLPWFVLVQHRNPEFFHFFFIHEHFERYLLPHHHRPGPWWYFAPVLLVALLPWTPSIPAALARGWKASASSGFKPDRFLVIWTAIVVLFFSASQSKLPGYVLPALPAILLLFARHYPAMSDGVRRAPALACVAGGVVLALLAGALPTLSAHLSWTEFDAGYSIWLFAAALALAAAGIAALGLLRRTRREASIAVLGLGSLLAAQLALSGAHVLDENYSSERLIKPVAGRELRFPRDAPFYSVATFDQSVPFYLGRPVTLVGYRDELAPGIASEPGKYVGSVDEFVSRWQEHGEAFAIMEPPLYEKLRARGLSGRVLARDTRQIILARR